MRKTWDWGTGKELLLFMYVMYKNVLYIYKLHI